MSLLERQAAQTVARFLEQQGQTAARLASRAGVSTNSVYKVLRGESVHLVVLQAVLAACGHKLAVRPMRRR